VSSWARSRRKVGLSSERAVESVRAKGATGASEAEAEVEDERVFEVW
jgi:hypothetical protein